MKLTKKQVYEFAKYYIGSQMAFIDGDNIGNLPDEIEVNECEKIVSEINSQGKKILGNREPILTPSEILQKVLNQ